MDTFAYHRLIPQADGSYQLVLYLDFKHEIARLPFNEIIESSGLLRNRVEEYIAHHLTEVNVTSARVMLGAIVVASFLLVYPGTANDADANLSPVTIPSSGHNSSSQGSLTQKPPPVKTTIPEPEPGKATLPTEGTVPIKTSVPPPNFGTILVLVNKQHSLSSGYVPGNLVSPKVQFTFAEDLPQRYMQAEAAQALERLFEQADQEGEKLYAVSGYRSYQRQAEIFARNNANSAEANRFSARAGQSEHQTGLAMDITNASLGTLTQAFGSTSEGRWLYANAHRFGFIIRYPGGKEAITGYSYEPWHVRYIGMEAAQTIMTNGITLEEYLGIRN
ncbi:MAG: D-alanyl-D-alanine carboxypeptidase family protein [Methanomassiliicoccales archaeon]